MKSKFTNDDFVSHADDTMSECIAGIDPDWIAGLIVYGGQVKLKPIGRQDVPKKFDAAVLNTGGRFGILLNKGVYIPSPPEIWVFHLCGNACDLDTDAKMLFDNYGVKIRERSNGDYTERVIKVINRLKKRTKK